MADSRDPNLLPEESVMQRKVLYRWKAPQRFFRKLDRKQFLVVGVFVVGFLIILAILGQYWLMGAIAAVMFLIYVLGTVSPVDTEHVLTNLGIETSGGKYKWADMDEYWFSERDGQYFVNVDMRLTFPGRILMLVRKEEMKLVDDVLRRRVRYRDMRKQGKVSKTVEGRWIDKLGEEKRVENSAVKKVPAKETGFAKEAG